MLDSAINLLWKSFFSIARPFTELSTEIVTTETPVVPAFQTFLPEFSLLSLSSSSDFFFS
jgi:hypothetical protein